MARKVSLLRMIVAAAALFLCIKFGETVERRRAHRYMLALLGKEQP